MKNYDFCKKICVLDEKCVRLQNIKVRVILVCELYNCYMLGVGIYSVN